MNYNGKEISLLLIHTNFAGMEFLNRNNGCIIILHTHTLILDKLSKDI